MKGVFLMKKIVSVLLVCIMCFALVSMSACGGTNGKTTINVFNWGQNISDGSDGYTDIIAEFEKQHPDIKVNYTTYATNEELYTKLSTGGVSYDVIIPSDYMIARLAEEGYLLELNFENIPNYELVDDTFKNQSYDPDNKYSVPYTWGTVGIIYNSRHVAEPTGWDVLWDENYAGKILMFGNPRDAFAIAAARLGYSFNTEDEAELRACADLLREQKPLVQQYVMDEIYDAMENEEAWIAPYYAGDFLMMHDNNPDLAFYLPENESFNAFIDAMCIPSCAEHKDEAETFINFITSPEISGANMDWIGYGSPVSAAKEFMDAGMATDPVVYPSAETLARGEAFAKLSTKATQLMDSLWLGVTTSK